tara:strand:+ start:719 stop:859 length:141 start_codon:yes stop_codon:yes gene_type:complete
MKNNYIKKLLKLFPNVASGRKNFENYDKRVKKNIELTKKYLKKNKL